MTNVVVEDILKNWLLDVIENPQLYNINEIYSFDITCQTLFLKQFTCIVSESANSFISRYDKFPKHQLKIKLKNIYNGLLLHYKKHPNELNDVQLEKKLNQLYKEDKEIYEPKIRFILWAIKNAPRLCISPETNKLNCDIKQVLAKYYNIIFETISEYEKNSSKILLKDAEYLYSTFIDSVIKSNFFSDN